MAIVSRENFAKVAYFIGIALALFQIYFTIGFAALEGTKMRTIFLSSIMVLIFLLCPARKLKPGEKEPVFCRDIRCHCGVHLREHGRDHQPHGLH